MLTQVVVLVKLPLSVVMLAPSLVLLLHIWSRTAHYYGHGYGHHHWQHHLPHCHCLTNTKALARWGVCVCVQVVFRHPHFIPYFRKVTPEEELGGLNIGSRPARYSTAGKPSPAFLMLRTLSSCHASIKPLSLKLHTHRTLPSAQYYTLSLSSAHQDADFYIGHMEE